MSAFLFTGAVHRLGRRGALIAWVTALALIIALVVGLLGWAISHAQAPAQPSPSNAILAMTRNDVQANSVVNEGVSARDGAVIWSNTIRYGAAQVASADGVYYTYSYPANGVHVLTAYRLSDGAQLWSIPSPAPMPAQPPLFVAHGLLFLGAMSATPSPVSAPETIYALDVTTHTVVWSAVVPSGIAMDKVYPAVAVNASMLFVGTASNGVQQNIGVTALRLRDGSVAWSQPISGSGNMADWPSRWLSAGPDAVYVADGTGAVVALRQSDGAVVWRSQPVTSGQGSIHLTYSGSTLYECAAASGVGQRPLLALDPTTGDVRWRDSSNVCYGRLIETDGVVYLAEQDLVAKRASDGAILWRVSPLSSGEGFLSIQVDAGVVIAAATVIGQSNSICSTIFLPGQSTQCQDTGYLAAFNAANGAPYWRKSVNNTPYLVGGGGFTWGRPVFFP